MRIASQTRIITSDVQIGGRHVPAALTLPFGNLFFGFENLRGPPGSASELAADATTPAVPFAQVGTGNTLSGRARSQASTPGGGNSPAVENIPGSAAARANNVPAVEEKPVVPFAGAGRSMSGRKPIETIVID